MKRLLLLSVLLITGFSFGQSISCNELFISEYVEGWANNKAIEIYNPTNDTIDLSNYTLTRSNYGGMGSSSVQLTGFIAPHEVHVGVLDKTDPNGIGMEAPVWDSLQQLADAFYCPDYNISGTMYFNGDDALWLSKDGVIVDIFGKTDQDPGDGWTTVFPHITGSGINVTMDHSLIRKNNVTEGVLVNPPFFSPLLEWDSIPPVYFDGSAYQGNWSTLGWHDCLCNTCPSSSSIAITSCQSIQLSNGNDIVNSGIFFDTLSTYFGCDSIVEIFFTYSPEIVNLNVSTCDVPYISPSGNQYTVSGQYSDTTYLGLCDTLYNINLTILQATSSNFNEISCGNYTLNGQTYSSSGTYTQTLTNSEGCDSTITLNLTVNPISFNPSFTVNQTLFTSPPFVCQFSNTTPSMGNYNFTWFWGDGTSLVSNNASVFHEYLFNGLYTVTLIAEDMNTGCSDTVIYSDYIYTTGGVSCTHSSIINQTGTLNVCSGDTLMLSCNSSGTFTYQWNRNGVTIPNSNNDTLYITQGGTYTVTIIEGGCPVTSSPISVTENNITQPVISSSGTIISCSGGSVTLDAGGGYSSYNWSSGGNQQLENVSQSGSYTVTVTSLNGCSSTSLPFVVNASFLPTQEICLVGVDSLTNFNRIVWEKPLIAGIDSFYVYRESVVSNVYTYIGAIDYADTAVFIDYNSNPSVQPYRYKLAMLDTCGIVTSMGDFHKTIHLTINQGIGTTYNLIWNSYEGLSFGSYNIYRGSSQANMSLLTTVQSSINSYTDLNPPAGPVYYQIEILGINCDPLKVVNFNNSKSNIADNTISGLNSIETYRSINIYPNPSSNIITIISETPINNKFKIYDQQGRVILSGNLNDKSTDISLIGLSSGVYTIRIEGNYKPAVLIKQ